MASRSSAGRAPCLRTAGAACRARCSSGASPTLFLVPIDGRRPARRLNAPLVPGGDVRPGETQPVQPPFAFSRDSRFVVYQADQETDEAVELFLSAVAARRLRPAQEPTW